MRAGRPRSQGELTLDCLPISFGVIVLTRARRPRSHEELTLENLFVTYGVIVFMRAGRPRSQENRLLIADRSPFLIDADSSSVPEMESPCLVACKLL